MLRKIKGSAFVFLASVSLLLVEPEAAACQKPYQLFIFGFEYLDQPVYFCDGARLNEINTKFILLNTLNPTEPQLVIDSIRSIQDLTQFALPLKVDNLLIEKVAISGGPYYTPLRLGTDTVRIIGYYGGYVSYGQIVCQARQLSSPLLYGYSFSRYEYGGNAVELTNYVLRDTLIDRMDRIYRIGSLPVSLGQNESITIRSCDGTVIDEIKMDSDFSEFTFHNLPSPGQSIPDSFAITYDFVPTIVGDHSRPISFRLSDGRWLTWIFQYRVRPAASVTSSKLPLGVTLKFIGDRKATVVSDHDLDQLMIVDIVGLSRRKMFFEGRKECELDLYDLSPGVYFIRSPSFSSPLKLILQ